MNENGLSSFKKLNMEGTKWKAETKYSQERRQRATFADIIKGSAVSQNTVQ